MHPFTILLLAIAICSCSQNSLYRSVVVRDLKAQNAKSIDGGLHADFRSFFIKKEGAGESKSEYIASLGDWDLPLHPDFTILSMTSKGNVVTVHVNEENDFSKGIGFPGWKATITYTVGEDGLILEKIYEPDSSNPDYKTWLAKPLAWLIANEPEQIKLVYDLDRKRLIKNRETARVWVDLLQKYKASVR